MNLLDARTVILMSTLMGGAMCVVLFSVWRSFPSEIGGVKQWALGLFCLVCAACCYGVRDALPDPLAPLAASALLLWGIGMSMIGTEKFYGLAPSWRLFHALWCVGMAGMGWLLLARASFGALIAVFSLLVLVFYVRQTMLIARHGERHLSSYFFGALMLTQSVVVLTRGAMATSGALDGVNLLKHSGYQSLFLAAGNFMSLLLTVGFMAVATRRLQTILEQRSTLDPLTSVLNRRGFADIYVKERAQMRRAGRVMTLLSIDLDFFKKINDVHGHASGDRMLMHVADIIGKALRESDHVARFGGEEFIVLLPQSGSDIAHAVAERIQFSLRAPCADGLTPCTVSIGLASQLDCDEELDGLLMRADAALYRAKENGRNRIEFAPADAAQPSRSAAA
ncbi:GGDEF domain-containing protein [Rugamonas sp.]|uniref:GGDEF domain-containing protein n=1 Tax=Rugamonas sp. TaxID=1926287 RepID=UPI0025F50EE7|nr:GGDEF domain-containing protein [Rugamonas sp.]